MLINPTYTLSDHLQAGLSCASLLLIIGVSFGAIVMSVYIAERPTFLERAVRFDKRLFTNVRCLFLISFIYYSLRRQNLKYDCSSSWSLFTFYLSLYISAIHVVLI